ncbi:hypothetical protein KC220_21585, partial [Mycobacterium tuberculosis]|nr:hypothetical protein [Mycobacterium tuberculosis]
VPTHARGLHARGSSMLRRSGWAYSEAAAQGWKRAVEELPVSHAGFLSVPDAAPAVLLTWMLGSEHCRNLAHQPQSWRADSQ